MTDRRPPKDLSPGTQNDEKTVKRAQPKPWDEEPTRVAPTPPQQAGTVRVPRSAFAATLIAGAAPEAERPEADADSSSPEAGIADEPTAAEPLRVPSNRPPPTPFGDSRNQRRDKTLLMPGSAPLSADRHPRQEQTDKKTPVVQYPAAAKVTGQRPITPAARGAATGASGAGSTLTGQGGEAARPAPAPGARPEGAKGTGPSHPGQRSGTVPAGNQTHGAVAGNGQAAPRQALAGEPGRSSIPSPAGRVTNSEPLRLQLAEHDILPELATTARPEVRASRAPLIGAGVLIAIAVVGVLLWMKGRAAEPTPPPATAIEDGRSSGVLAQPETQAPATTPAAPAQAAQPAAAAAAPTQPTPGAAPAATAEKPKAEAQPSAEPNPPAAAAAAPPSQAPTAAAAPARTKASQHKDTRAKHRTATARSTPALRVPGAPPEASDSIEGARAALKDLEKAPVLSVKPSDGADTPAAPLAPPDEPPPAPEGE